MAEIEMNIVRKQQNFTIIDNGIFKDKSLSAKAKGILTTMLSLPSTWNYSIAGLTTLFSDSETSIRTGLQELEKAGYLKRERIHENGKIIKWKYTLYEVKQIENLDVENQQVENLQLEFNTQLNNNKSRTNELSNKDNTKVLSVETASINNNFQDNFLGSCKKKKKSNVYTECVALINNYTDNRELQTCLVEFVKMRIAVKKLQTSKQFTYYLDNLDSIEKEETKKIEVVKRTLKNGWAEFYPLPTKNTYSGTRNNDKFSEGKGLKCEAMTDEDYKQQEEMKKQFEKDGKQWYF